eukprot:6197094-Alexandrium_andersonii.AAC.1
MSMLQSGQHDRHCAQHAASMCAGPDVTQTWRRSYQHRAQRATILNMQRLPVYGTRVCMT